MNEFKGTPGPWFWDAEGLGNKDIIVFGREYPIDMTSKENKALITAAPELLEALQGIMSLFPVIEDDGTGRVGFTTETIQKLNTAQAAIAKALDDTK